MLYKPSDVAFESSEGRLASCIPGTRMRRWSIKSKVEVRKRLLQAVILALIVTVCDSLSHVTNQIRGALELEISFISDAFPHSKPEYKQ